MIWIVLAVLAGVAAGFATWLVLFEIAVRQDQQTVEALLISFGVATAVGTGVFAFVALP